MIQTTVNVTKSQREALDRMVERGHLVNITDAVRIGIFLAVDYIRRHGPEEFLKLSKESPAAVITLRISKDILDMVYRLRKIDRRLTVSAVVRGGLALVLAAYNSAMEFYALQREEVDPDFDSRLLRGR